MKPLIVLISVFIIVYLISKLSGAGKVNYKSIATIAISSMLIFTGVGHFVFTQGMKEMIPQWIVHRELLVIASGIFEILAAIFLLIPKYRKQTGFITIIFLLLVLPLNIYAAINHIDPVSGSSEGHGPEYLFFRIPLQFLFIGWIYLGCISTK